MLALPLLLSGSAPEIYFIIVDCYRDLIEKLERDNKRPLERVGILEARIEHLFIYLFNLIYIYGSPSGYI